jgi:hypothetical protein
LNIGVPLDRRDIGLVPGLLALALFGAWAADGGGFRTTAWYPGALLLLGLLAVSVIGLGSRLVVPARTWAPIALLVAFTGWSYLSMTWAGVSATAWDGANRTAVYLVVFALFAAFQWRPLAAGVWLTLFVFTVALIATLDFVAALQSSHPNSHFIYGRFTGPIEYPNGSACLYLMAAWPAVVLAAQRALPWALRAFLAATAAYLVELTLLTQSRGAVVGVLVTSVIFLVVNPMRIRALGIAAIVVLAAAAASGELLDVYRVVSAHGDTQGALERAGRAVLWSCLAVFVFAAAVAIIDERWSLSASSARWTRRTVATVLAVIGAAFIAVAIAKTDPTTRARHAWHQFTGTPKPYGVGLANPNSHFAANPLSGNRYDVWRVAWHQFKRAPAKGAGADNFAVDYLRERRSDEEPQYPFSIELRALGQLGLVGAVLLLGFFVSCAVTLIRPRRASGAAVAAAGATLVATQWLAHGSVDIFWELPGLAAPAFAALAVGVRVTDAETSATAGRPRTTTVVSGLVLVMAAGLAISAVFPWLAAANVRSAEGTWRTNPAGAAEKLSRARALNPLSDEADVVAGVIAGRQRRWTTMRASFRHAVRRNRLGWYSWFELGVVDAYTHRRADALVELRQAKRLDPREWTIGFVRYRLGIGKPLPPSVLDRIFRIRYAARTAPAAPLKR